MCEQSYFLTYTLGLPAPAGKKAALGNITHKALEILAWQSYHEARGNSSYVDETFGELRLAEITPDRAVDWAYSHYKAEEPHHDWKDRFDLRDCKAWTHAVLEMNGGYFDPRNMDVVEPEKRFDITIDEPWARYEYETPDGVVEGQMGLKGTIDLVTRDRHDTSIIELIDYKTGRRLDWATGDVKDYEKLEHDPQLLLYYYAFSRVYPEVSDLVFTIIYVNDGGPFRFSFGKDHMEEAERLIRARFEEIRAVRRPALNVSWKCQKLCHHGKTMSTIDPSKTVCQFFEDQLRRKTADQVTHEFGKKDAFLAYGSGGGRQSATL